MDRLSLDEKRAHVASKELRLYRSVGTLFQISGPICRMSMVLCFYRKPNWLSISILFSSRKKYNLLCTIFSCFCLVYRYYISESGKTPVSNDLFIISMLIGVEICSSIDLNKYVLTLS